MSLQITKSVAGFSFINLIGNSLRSLLAFVTLILASRWLGTHEFGRICLILAYTSYLHYLLTLGFDHSLPYFIGRHRPNAQVAQGKHVLTAGLVFSITLGGCLTLIAIKLIPFILEKASMPDLFWPVLLLIIQTEFGALGYILGGFLRSVKAFLPVIIKDQILFPVFHLIGLLVFVKIMSGGLLGYATGYASATVLCLIFITFYTVRTLSRTPARGSHPKNRGLAHWRSWLAFSFPLGVMSALEPFLLTLSVMLAGWYLAPSEVAKIAVGIRISLFVQFLLIAMIPIFSPYMAELFRKRQLEDFRDLYQTVNYWCSKWALLFSFFLVTSAEFVLSLFGSDYVAASICLMIILPGSVCEGCFGGTRMSLVMAGKNTINIAFALFAIIVQIGAGVWLIPHLGLIGVALAYSLSYGLLNLVRLTWFYRSFGITPLNRRHLRNLGLLLFVTGCLAWGIRSLNLSLLSTVTSAVIVFCLGLTVSFWKDKPLFFANLAKVRGDTTQML